jgi:hypothetical protein
MTARGTPMLTKRVDCGIKNMLASPLVESRPPPGATTARARIATRCAGRFAGCAARRRHCHRTKVARAVAGAAFGHVHLHHAHARGEPVVAVRQPKRVNRHVHLERPVVDRRQLALRHARQRIAPSDQALLRREPACRKMK